MNQSLNEVYAKLEKIIENGIKGVINEKSPIYDEYKIIVSNEQQFIKTKEKDDKCIYIVVQYGKATVHYGQIIMPFSLSVLSEKNRLKIAQQLLYDYSIKNNMKYNENKTIYQIIETPTKSFNFQILFEDFRSVLQSNGTFIISETANFYGLIYHSDEIIDLRESCWELNDILDFKIYDKKIVDDKIWKVVFRNEDPNYQYYFYGMKLSYSNGSMSVILLDDLNNETIIYTEKDGWIEIIFKKIFFISGDDIKNEELMYWLNNNAKLLNKEDLEKVDEEVDFLNSALKCDIIPDTQAFYFKQNFTNSINKFANLGFSIVLYNVSDSCLVNDVLKIMTKKGDVNKTFNFSIQFLKNHSLRDNFKLINISADQQIGTMTTIVLTFVN